jgi:hypothetical protein
MNDASYIESPLQGYSPSSLASIRAESHKYNATGAFQNLQNAGFLISKTS